MVLVQRAFDIKLLTGDLIRITAEEKVSGTVLDIQKRRFGFREH